MRQHAARMIRGLGRRLTSDGRERLNQSCMPLGMLDVERITRVSTPVSVILTRPHAALSATADEPTSIPSLQLKRSRS